MDGLSVWQLSEVAPRLAPELQAMEEAVQAAAAAVLGGGGGQRASGSGGFGASLGLAARPLAPRPPRPKRVLFCCHGSRGDVQPLVALALGLVAKGGYEVREGALHATCGQGAESRDGVSHAARDLCSQLAVLTSACLAHQFHRKSNVNFTLPLTSDTVKTPPKVAFWTVRPVHEFVERQGLRCFVHALDTDDMMRRVQVKVRAIQTAETHDNTCRVVSQYPPSAHT